MGKLDCGQDDLFGLFLGARLNHDDAVFVADDHDVDGCGGALRIGGIDYKLTVHTADAHSANGRAEWNVRKSLSASCGIDAYHVRVVLLVRGKDQGNYLSLIAETVRKQRTDGAVDVAAGQDFFFAGTAFALDESEIGRAH